MRNNSSCNFYLKYGRAQAFYEEAFHPNLDALKRRDDFINTANREQPYWHEGKDLVSEIPDIDIDTLLAQKIEYQNVFVLEVPVKIEMTSHVLESFEISTNTALATAA